MYDPVFSAEVFPALYCIGMFQKVENTYAALILPERKQKFIINKKSKKTRIEQGKK